MLFMFTTFTILRTGLSCPQWLEMSAKTSTIHLAIILLQTLLLLLALPILLTIQKTGPMQPQVARNVCYDVRCHSADHCYRHKILYVSASHCCCSDPQCQDWQADCWKIDSLSLRWQQMTWYKQYNICFIKYAIGRHTAQHRTHLAKSYTASVKSLPKVFSKIVHNPKRNNNSRAFQDEIPWL